MMLWLVFTTGACNLRCSYCGGSFNPKVVPWRINYNPVKLKELIEKDNNATVIFYGGEPLLNPRFIMWMMDNVKANRWGIQTNGTLTELLPSEYWRRMSVVLLSIDGRREVTDAHRGFGVYNRVVKALMRLKSMGVNRLIARMAVTRLTDIYIDVTHLLNVGFNLVHWQLDVIWDGKWDVLTWAKSSYLPGVRRLVELFLSNLREGRVIGIVPILGVLSAYLHKPYRGPPCGAGYSSIAVSTDGRVLSCPIAVHEDWAVLGNVNTGFNLIGIESQLPEMCKTCEYRQYCGGRCLYAIKEGERYWGLDGVLTVDYVTKETIRTILEIGPEVKELVNRGVVKLSDLYYDPILDSTEVIP
mgnify:FL=1